MAQANILKQTALIFGADCAINRNVITGNIEKSDVILCGSYSQLLKISEKLKSQPFKLAILAKEIEDFLKPSLRKTKIVGILNVTPDSFSDGGLYNEPQTAIKKLVELFEDGADMVDIGAESTRPNSVAVNSEEQIKRLKPVLEFIQKEFNGKLPISVDTRSSDVADFALNLGVNIINDVSGAEYDPKILNVVSKYNAGIILQHSKGTPNSEPVYTKVWGRINCETKTTIVEEESAFGEAAVKKYERKTKEWVITGTAKVPYEFGDEEILTGEELTKAMQAREVMLADIKKRSEEYKAQKAAGNTNSTSKAQTGVKPAAKAGTFNF